MAMIEELTEHGIRVQLEGNELKFAPKSKLTPALIERIKARRQEIARELRQPTQERRNSVAYCSWLKTEISKCQYPCYQWEAGTGNKICDHFRQYMMNIKRWQK